MQGASAVRDRISKCAAAMIVVGTAGCPSAQTAPASPSPAPVASTPAPLPADCGAPHGVFSVSTALAAPDHDCSPWLKRTVGRVLRSGGMSGVVWTTDVEAEVGILLSAVHTLGEGWFARAGQVAPVTLKDPSEGSGVVRLELPTATGELSGTQAPLFMMFQPGIPAEQTGDKLHRIEPRHDFFVAAMDGQRFPLGGDGNHLGAAAGPLQSTPPQLSDPDGLLGRSHRDAKPGERVLMLGYPNHGPHAGKLAGSVGVVLDAGQVQGAMEELRAAGDEEGNLAYAPEVEHIVRGTAVPGMSGGGVFDVDGHLVGVLVRGSTETQPPGYVRFVRLSFITGELSAAISALPDASRKALARYLPAALTAPTAAPAPE